MENKTRSKENELQLIPKSERYIQYVIEMINKMPRTEKFSIGTEFKNSMYEMLKNIMYISKIDMKKRSNIMNTIDAELNTQRIFLRIMYKNKWIDNKKFENSMKLIYEIGKIIGGLTKYYAKYNKE